MPVAAGHGVMFTAHGLATLLYIALTACVGDRAKLTATAPPRLVLQNTLGLQTWHSRPGEVRMACKCKTRFTYRIQIVSAATFRVQGPPQSQHSVFATELVHVRATTAHALSTKAWLLMFTKV